MANFKTHFSVGILLGIIFALTALASGLMLGWTMITLVIITVTIGAFLPDVDSESAIPFRVVFYSLGIIASIFAFIWAMKEYTGWVFISMLSLSAFIVVRFVFGYIFKKLTKHRGIFHSIPMAILIMLLTLTFLKELSSLPRDYQAILSISIGIGFLSHLILDEIYAAINFNGKKFLFNRHMGSALKLWSKSPAVTALTYSILFILFIINF